MEWSDLALCCMPMDDRPVTPWVMGASIEMMVAILVCIMGALGAWIVARQEAMLRETRELVRGAYAQMQSAQTEGEERARVAHALREKVESLEQEAREARTDMLAAQEALKQQVIEGESAARNTRRQLEEHAAAVTAREEASLLWRMNAEGQGQDRLQAMERMQRALREHVSDVENLVSESTQGACQEAVREALEEQLALYATKKKVLRMMEKENERYELVMRELGAASQQIGETTATSDDLRAISGRLEERTARLTSEVADLARWVAEHGPELMKLKVLLGPEEVGIPSGAAGTSLLSPAGTSRTPARAPTNGRSLTGATFRTSKTSAWEVQADGQYSEADRAVAFEEVKRKAGDAAARALVEVDDPPVPAPGLFRGTSVRPAPELSLAELEKNTREALRAWLDSLTTWAREAVTLGAGVLPLNAAAYMKEEVWNWLNQKLGARLQGFGGRERKAALSTYMALTVMCRPETSLGNSLSPTHDTSRMKAKLMLGGASSKECESTLDAAGMEYVEVARRYGGAADRDVQETRFVWEALQRMPKHARQATLNALPYIVPIPELGGPGEPLTIDSVGLPALQRVLGGIKEICVAEAYKGYAPDVIRGDIPATVASAVTEIFKRAGGRWGASAGAGGDAPPRAPPRPPAKEPVEGAAQGAGKKVSQGVGEGATVPPGKLAPTWCDAHGPGQNHNSAECAGRKGGAAAEARWQELESVKAAKAYRADPEGFGASKVDWSSKGQHADFVPTIYHLRKKASAGGGAAGGK